MRHTTCWESSWAGRKAVYARILRAVCPHTKESPYWISRGSYASVTFLTTSPTLHYTPTYNNANWSLKPTRGSCDLMLYWNQSHQNNSMVIRGNCLIFIKWEEAHSREWPAQVWKNHWKITVLFKTTTFPVVLSSKKPTSSHEEQ